MKNTILIVDDSKEILTNLKYILSSEFHDIFNIEISDNPIEALDLIDELRKKNVIVPFVIIDFMMPVMNGDIFLKKLYEKHPDILSILLTGFGTLDGIANALNNSNLFMFISKPWENDQLILSCKKAYDNYLKTYNLNVLNEKLLNLDKTKNFVISLLAHELYTPINTIKMSTNILLTNNDEDTNTYKSYVKISTDRLLKIADNALLYTKLLTNKFKFKFEQINIHHFIDSNLFNLSDVIRNSNILLSREFDTLIDNHILNIDVTLLNYVFKSIVENSIKFNSSEITIITKLKKNKISLIIDDNGNGFDQTYLKNKFQILASDDVIHHSEGIGMSLAISKFILDSHNFSIDASNKSLGALVEITFPI